MNVSQFRAIHTYGAILSVLAMLGAVVAFAVGAPDPLVFFLGFLGPLCGFYFIGAVLEVDSTYHVVGEELLRGVVWYGGSLLGWAFILTSTTSLPTTPVTALGLPAITALGLALMMVGIRQTSGLDLKVQTEGGQLLVAITGAIVGGFVVLYAVLVRDQSLLLVLLYVLATVGGIVGWRWHWRRQRPSS